MNRRDWKRAKQRRQDDLLDRLVRERRPESLETLARYRLRTADVDELGVLIDKVIVYELTELGFGADWEPTEYGLELEELLDVVNSRRAALQDEEGGGA